MVRFPQFFWSWCPDDNVDINVSRVMFNLWKCGFLQPALPSSVPTTADEEISANPQAEDTSEGSEGATTRPAVDKPISLGGTENSTADFSFTPGEFDQSTGSGMQPPVSEEGTVSATAPIREPKGNPTGNKGGDEGTAMKDDDTGNESKITKYTTRAQLNLE